MVQLAEIQRQSDELSAAERKDLLTYLLRRLPGMPEGPDDEELARREEEMDSGAVTPLSHEEFLVQVGRGGR